MVGRARLLVPWAAALVTGLMVTAVPARADTGAAPDPAAPGAAFAEMDQTIGPGLPGPPNAANNLVYNAAKGPVMHNAVVYTVFWLPTGHYESAATAASDTAFENLQNRFFQDIGNSQFYTVVSQYPDTSSAPGSVVTFGGTVTDTTNAYPHAGTVAAPLEDGDIQAEVTRMKTSQGWTEDSNHIYMVYIARNLQQCFPSLAARTECTFPYTGQPNSYCAYHTHFSDGGNDAVYAFMGDNALAAGCGPSGGPNNDQTADAQVSVSSHEFIEAVTEPDLNGWGPVSSEIGDKCNNTPAPQNSIGADVYMGGTPNPYVIQMEWSNVVATCAMSRCGSSFCPTPPNLNKTADATVTTGRNFGTTITVRNPSNTDTDTNVTVTDTLPTGATYVSGSANPAPTSIGASTLTWNLGTLAVHDQVTITYQSKAGAALQNNTNLHNCASVTYGDMLKAAQPAPPASCADTTAVNQPPVLILPGDQLGAFHDPMSFTISATDVELDDTLTFGSSALPAGLTLTNNGDRTATVAGIPTATPGVYVVTFSVNDAHNPDVTGTLKITIAVEESALQYTGPTVIANGQPVTLTANLFEDGSAATPISGRLVTFTLGSGGSAQTCSGFSLADGSVSCQINPVNQALGPNTVCVVFAGDTFYLPSSTCANVVSFGFLAQGAFVIGDQNAAVGTAVEFWGADWAVLNALSGGAAPRAFKGFAADTAEPPANGNNWMTEPGNSSAPPSGPLPAFMGVIVADNISKSGRTIAGDTVHIVVVQVAPGYASNPGHPGTGKVVAVYS